MTATDPLGEVTIRRRMDPARQIMSAEGRFGPFLEAYLQHVDRWEIPLDGLTQAMMRQGLAATVLHLAFRPGDESVGFTFNFSDPPVNVFVSGDAAAASVTGRAFVDGVQTAESSRFFVQSYRTGTGVRESAIDVSGLDVLDILEDYYRRSEQHPARFLEPEENRFVMALALPDADRPWLGALDPAGVVSWLDGDLRTLDERRFLFRCGCTPERVLHAVKGMFANRPDEIFQGDSSIEALCPRCGVRYQLTREEFDAHEADTD